MADGRSVVVTGASRGLGLATAAHLHRQGWTVVAAMRTPDKGMVPLRAAAGAAEGDPRLIAVPLDLEDPDSIAAAAGAIEEAVGAPYGIVHNAGTTAVGTLEEMPQAVWDQIFATNLLGPVRLTRALLPGMREAGRGRLVLVSSEGGLRGMPAVAAYSASKAGLERWGESLAHEVAPFGLGVSVLVTGSFKTDILELTPSYADLDGPYAPFHGPLERRGRRLTQLLARDPARFGPAVAKALDERAPYTRRAVGIDAHLLLLCDRLLPGRLLHGALHRFLGLPRR